MALDDRSLMTLPWFSSLDEPQRRALAAMLTERTYGPGQTIFEQGQPGLYCGFVTFGEVRIVAQGDPGERAGTLATLSVGELVGEMALLDGSRRAADCVAGESGALLAVLARHDFNTLFNADNPFAFALMNLIAGQLARRLHHGVEVLTSAAATGVADG